ncbi:hypothetical protein [Rufibacter latericius]|uniref:DUF2798 domain-containing protein n=1 Tax=Rufibacter latericius TaxID=2487040 RepID=A0A3M9MLR5_9BACT|nr:hypothetical protein [Rufibacter latericius]RNI26147.1 hypothetical protein EFB08_15130 [Rufibacter latericius]
MAKVVKRHPFQRDWRRDLLIAALISMLLAMALLLYAFGLTSDFISRLFNAFLVIFLLMAGTAFVIVPGVNWVFLRLSGKAPKAPKKASAAPKRPISKAKAREPKWDSSDS